MNFAFAQKNEQILYAICLGLIGLLLIHIMYKITISDDYILYEFPEGLLYYKDID